MDFELHYSSEQESFRDDVRVWLSENVPKELVESGGREASEDPAVRNADYSARRALGRALGAKGWLYPSSPSRYGGGGLPLDSVIVLHEETHRLGLELPPYYDSGGKFGAACILTWGTDEQREELLPPIYTGEVRTWQLLSEPGAGSDLAAVRTSANRDGSDFVINGQKIYAGSEHGAERLWMLAVTDPDGARHENLGWFMVDAGSPGVSMQRQELLSVVGEGGQTIGHKNTIYFDNVRVPESRLVGGVNNGWRVASTHLGLEHGSLGRIRRDRVWDGLLAYAQGEMRGMLDNDQDFRDTLCDIYVQVEVIRLLSLRNFWMTHSGRESTYEGPQLSYVRKLTGLRLARQLQDLFGPSALTDDVLWGAMSGIAESQQREGIVGIHPGGTTDILRTVIARHLGLGRKKSRR